MLLMSTMMTTMLMLVTTMTPGGSPTVGVFNGWKLPGPVLPFKGAATCENHTCHDDDDDDRDYDDDDDDDDDDDGDDDDQDHIVKDNVEESAAGTEVPRRVPSTQQCNALQF